MNTKNTAIDILLILEGTYPYVQGGVSAWVAHVIQHFHQHTFAIIFIGSRLEDYPKGKHYALPQNVLFYNELFLFETVNNPPTLEPTHGNVDAFKANEKLHHWCQNSKNSPPPNIALTLDFYLNADTGIDEQQFLTSKLAWDFIQAQYQQHYNNNAFIDYFWSVRNMHAPIWKLAQTASMVPEVKMIHSVSTGYAGFLGALLQSDRKIPYLISEHGIYTKERRIDLLNYNWINDHTTTILKDPTELNYLTKMWINFFEVLARLAYQKANYIISLFDEYNKLQILDGAPAEKTKIISNGVNLKKYAALYQARDPGIPAVIALIGRVVPIKDIKTFIRAASLMLTEKPELEAWIIGPIDENKEYVLECQNLIISLELTDKIKILGTQNLDLYYPKISLIVLSSISEGLPLVLLEAFACGIPAVATDVGACRELILGNTAEDKALGAAGDIVPIANPTRLATSCLNLLNNPLEWHKAQSAALERVKKYYNEKDVWHEYQTIYQTLIGQ